MSLDLVMQAVAEYHAHAPEYALYRDYHDGKHRFSFASPKFRAKYSWVLRAARENLCPAVVSAHVDRLIVESWGDNADEAAQEGMTRLAKLVHTEAHVTGDAFTLTWYRPDRVANQGVVKLALPLAETLATARAPVRPEMFTSPSRSCSTFER